MSAVRVVLVLLLVAAVTGSPATAQVQHRDNGWSERGLFIFSPGYFFDFWRQRAGPYGAHVQSSLSDCSTSDYYCMYEGWFALAVPRACRAMQMGDEWAVGDITMRVVGRTPVLRDPHSFPTGEYFGWILMSDGRPNAAYLYDPPYGVKTIYMGGEGVDVRTLAETGRLGEQGAGASAMHLISPDSMGWCQE